MSRYYLITLKDSDGVVPIEDGNSFDDFIPRRLANITFHPHKGNPVRLIPENIKSYEEVDEDTFRGIEHQIEFPPINIPAPSNYRSLVL